MTAAAAIDTTAIHYDPHVGLSFKIADLGEGFTFAFYVTNCCLADGKGSANSPTGVCCRACHQPVPVLLGGGPSAARVRLMTGLVVSR